MLKDTRKYTVNVVWYGVNNTVTVFNATGIIGFENAMETYLKQYRKWSNICGTTGRLMKDGTDDNSSIEDWYNPHAITKSVYRYNYEDA